VASMAATRLLSALLFGVEPADPSTFLAGAGALVAVVLLASALPAVRAAATDPVSVLRAE
jgi:putative ABC transport system permease protein